MGDWRSGVVGFWGGWGLLDPCPTIPKRFELEFSPEHRPVPARFSSALAVSFRPAVVYAYLVVIDVSYGVAASMKTQTIEAFVDEQGEVHLLEPIQHRGVVRALVIVLDEPLRRDEMRARPYGLCAGDFVVPDDFDAPLPDHILAEFEGNADLT